MNERDDADNDNNVDDDVDEMCSVKEQEESKHNSKKQLMAGYRHQLGGMRESCRKWIAMEGITLTIFEPINESYEQ